MTYLVGDQVAESLAEVAKILEVSKVTAKDIKTGGKYADLVTVKDTEADELLSTGAGEDLEEDDKITYGEDTLSSGESEEPTDEPTPEVEDSDDVRSAMPDFANLDELKEFIKDIDTPLLEYLATGLGCTWNPTDNPQIHRMRVALSMHHYFFPELFVPKESKKKGKYGDRTDEQLAAMAEEHKVKWDVSTHAPINRMRLIMALKKSGHLPE